jgi:peptidoglycan hydrolase-like protein with peptidoglycan-binding domain
MTDVETPDEVADDEEGVAIEVPTEDDTDESMKPGTVVPPPAPPALTMHPPNPDSEVLADEPQPFKFGAAFDQLLAAAPKPPSVPRPRSLHLGSTGLDVIAVKRALSRAGFMRWGNFTNLFGKNTVTAVKNFQKAHGIKPASGAYGAGSHAALTHSHSKAEPTEWAFDDYSIFLMREESSLLATTPEERIRKAMLSAGYYCYAHRNQIPYRQSRPFPLKRPPYVPVGGIDCSGGYTLWSFCGGAPDPNGRGYDGQGYTGTLMSRGRSCSYSELKPGDAVFYGFTSRPSSAFPYGSPTHVAMYVGGGMVLSNGHSPMGLYAVRYRGDLNHYRTYSMGG